MALLHMSLILQQASVDMFSLLMAEHEKASSDVKAHFKPAGIPLAKVSHMAGPKGAG